MYIIYLLKKQRSKVPLKPLVNPSLKKVLKNNRGQIIVEYVLLLLIAVVIATTLVSTLVSRSADDPGIITGKWSNMLKVIGDDQADNPKSE